MKSYLKGQHNKSEERFSLSQLLSVVVIGAAICLLGLNYWHAMDCPNTNPDAIETHIEAISRRLIESENMIKKNSDTLSRLMKDMEDDLTKFDKSTREQIHDSSQKEAVKVALRQSKVRAPPKPDSFEEHHGITTKSDLRNMNGKEVPGDKGSEYDFDDDYIQGDDPLLASSQGKQQKGVGGNGEYHDDFIADDHEKEGLQWRDPDTFGGKRDTKNKYDNQVVKGDDPFDDPGSAAEAGEVFRDNLSDADARGICQSWKNEHNVVVGVSWGSLPFQLQQKWLQYACDFLLV